jgi:hypothetical protein
VNCVPVAPLDIGQKNTICCDPSDWRVAFLDKGVIAVTVLFLVHAVPVIVIACVLTCPIFVTSDPDEYNVGFVQLNPGVARHELVPVLPELNTPSRISDAMTTATISIDHPYVIRYSTADWALIRSLFILMVSYIFYAFALCAQVFMLCRTTILQI